VVSFFFYLFYSSPNLSSRRLDIYHISTHDVWKYDRYPICLSANLECRSEMYCTRLAGNARRKNRRLGAIAQLCRAISSQLRHVSTIGKNSLNIRISPMCPHNTVNFGLLEAEIVSLVWGTPANVNRFRVFAALLHSTLVVGVSQTLRR